MDTNEPIHGATGQSEPCRGGEVWYDGEIAPVLLDLANKCRDCGCSFVAVVEYAPGERGRTRALTHDAGLEMVNLAHCAKMGAHIDGYVMGLVRHCKEKGIRYDSSMVMRLMAGEKPF